MALRTLTSRNEVKSGFLGGMCSLTRRNWKTSGFQEAETAKGPKEDIHGVHWGPRSGSRRIRSVAHVSVPRAPAFWKRHT